MLKKLKVTNHIGDSIEVDFRNIERSPFLITDITGIGSAKADVNTQKVAGLDGAFFNSARLNTRQITLTIKYNWYPTIEDARHLTYVYFPVKKKIRLDFVTDSRSLYIEGYVSENTPVIFASQSGTQIVIDCPDPNFYGVNDQITTFYGVETTFEFPFSNESLVEPMINLGEMHTVAEATINYVGDDDIGTIISIHSIGKAGDVTIFNSNTLERMTINNSKLAAVTGNGIMAGDDIIINSMSGQKSIKLIRAGEITSILNCIDKNSDWFTLQKGENKFAYTSSEGFRNLQFVISNKVVYEGV